MSRRCSLALGTMAIGLCAATGGNLGVITIPTTTSSVPEPSTWAMMLLGFAGLGYADFKRMLAT
jgi:hypothetical protein